MLTVCFLLLLTLGIGTRGGGAADVRNFTVVQFIHSIKWQKSFECVLWAQQPTVPLAESFFGNDGRPAEQQIMSVLQVPMLHMTDGAKFQLKRNVNRNLLALLQLTGVWSEDQRMLQTMASALSDMRQIRILALLSVDEVDEGFLRQFFAQCWQHKMLNVIVLFADYQDTQLFYRYTPFPQLTIETRSICAFSLQSTPIFESSMADMKGYNVSYLLSGADPRIITYVKANGELYVGGSSGHLLLAFARKHNFNFVEALPLQTHGRKSSQEASEYLRAGTIEISAGVTFPEYPYRGSTYPYEELNACLLIPVEADVPHYEFYLVVFSWGAFGLTLVMFALISVTLNVALHRHGYRIKMLELFVHNNCLRGLLAQPFTSLVNPPPVVRLIYVQIFVFGIMLTSFYNSYFSTYLTHPPKQPRIHTLDDLLHSGMKAYIYTAEVEQLLAMAPSYKAYSPIFLQEPNFEKYLKTRDSLDPRYVYVVPTVKRIVINEQQKTFSSILFRQGEEICVYRNMPFGFPLLYNSIFTQPLNRVIRHVAEAGLDEYWRQFAFYELIAAGKMHISDLSQTKQFEAMRLDDLRYIWMGMAFMWSITCLVFIGELCVHNRCAHKCVAVLGQWRWWRRQQKLSVRHRVDRTF